MAKIMNHIEYPKSLKKLAIEALNFRIKDAQEAHDAMPTGENAGYYLDEVHYCKAELKKRTKVLKEQINDFDLLVKDVTRFEVIGEGGRLIVRENVKIEMHFQDGMRTLKVFMNKGGN